jgi:cullin-associated NEDD8-dissociated protein 1
MTHLFRALELGAADGVEREVAVGDMGKLGQAPLDAPSVFNFFLPEFAPTGPVQAAGLTAPEGQLLVGPKVMSWLNGAVSLSQYGLSGDCDGTAWGDWTLQLANTKTASIPKWIGCATKPYGSAATAVGRVGRESTLALRWQPATADVVDELDVLLTAGRLGAESRGVVEKAFDDAKYYFHPQPATWADAKATCEQWGGALAGPCSEAENDLMMAAVPPTLDWEVWIGVQHDDGDVSRVSGESCDYANWADWEPDTDGCVTMIAWDEKKYWGMWSTQKCNKKNKVPFVCQDVRQDVTVASQLMSLTPEFHATNAHRVDAARATETTTTKAGAPDVVSDYKAIVYLFLAGGADSFSMIVPESGCSNDLARQYKDIRGDVALASTLKIDAANQPCSKFGVHPSMPAIHESYKDDGDLAFVANVGPMVEPIATADEFEAGARDEPPALFSHNVQTVCAMNVHAQDANADGVLGRIGDALDESFAAYSIFGEEPKVLEGAAGLRPVADILASFGVAGLADVARTLESSIRALTSKVSTSIFSETYAERTISAIDRSYALDATLKAHELVNGRCEALSQNRDLMDQFEQVGRLIRGKDQLGSSRAVFHVQLDGFDTHSDNGPAFAALASEFDEALDCFKKEMIAQGMWDSVVVVQASEFGRTLTSNGQGTDHGWGGNSWVAGGSVKGGQIVGKFPSDLTQDSPLSIDEMGRLIPTTSWESLWLGVAQWFGVSDDKMPSVLPNLANFPASEHISKAQLFR